MRVDIAIGVGGLVLGKRDAGGAPFDVAGEVLECRHISWLLGLSPGLHR